MTLSTGPFANRPFAGGSRLSAEAGNAAATAMASSGVALVQLVLLDFDTPIALNSSTWTLTWDGTAYIGAYGLGTVSPIDDKPGELQGLTFELFGDAAVVALALDESDVVQGTPVTIRTAILDIDTGTILDAPVEWSGTLDTMAIAEDGQTCIIKTTAESKGIDLLRGTPMYYTDADQKTINATDGSFKYVIDQIDKPIVWPARGYFFR